ncbi:MAG: FtsX-like permease family protein [Bryobacteraceae bacterium]
MKKRTLLLRGLWHYRRVHGAVLLGVATAAAVLAGSLMVGDSVRASLRQLALNRIGNTDLVLSAVSYFGVDFAARVTSGSGALASALIATEGMASAQESGRRASKVLVYGVDDSFWRFHGRSRTGPEDRDALVSPQLARELAASPGDTLLLRVDQPAAIPKESLHGRKDLPGKVLRVTLAEVLAPEDLGEFSPAPTQGGVRAVFVPLERLQRELGVAGRANTLLVGAGDAAAVERAVRDSYRLDDLGLRLKQLDQRRGVAFEAASGVLDDRLVEAAAKAGLRLGAPQSRLLTYLANTIRIDAREIPYSLVTAVEDEQLAALAGRAELGADSIVLNEWAARELQARLGERVTIEYYLWTPEGRLVTESAEFTLAAVTPLRGPADDRDVAPEYPGITEARTIQDWDPPFPMDLRRIRPSDEEYWDRHRTTPKAWIPLARGQELWRSRFGQVTGIRFAISGLDGLERALREEIYPLEVGFVLYPARRQALEASAGATDFGEYFVYFSFFLVVSALLLAGLFFRLGVEQRVREVGLLTAVGLSQAEVRRLFLGEGLVIAGLGSLAGIAGAVGYSWLILYGLRTWWVGAVGTTLLELHVTPASLAAGAVGGVLAAMAFIAWTLRGLHRVPARALLAGIAALPDTGRKVRKRRERFWAPVLGMSGLASVGAAAAGWFGEASGFFAGGTLLLIALLRVQADWLRRERADAPPPVGTRGLLMLSARNAGWRPGRSVLCITLIALATFLLVSLEAFRRDGADEAGSGGYPLIAESLLPIVHDLNDPEGREALLLDRDELDGVNFVPFRYRPGDDVSCLNLYQPRNPRIIAPTSAFLREGRFDFSGSLAEGPEERANPWLLLDTPQPDGAVAAIADANSLAYVLHRKVGGLIEIPREGAAPIRLRIVAALRGSLFQSEILIGSGDFVRLFPREEGYRLFLIEAPGERVAEVTTAIEHALSDFGFDVAETRERLAAYHQVENTYLSTFQALGAFGLLLGTVGLGAVLLRNVLERRRELALLRAVGLPAGSLGTLVLAENGLLLSLGLATGAGCAVIAILPAWLARGGEARVLTMGLLVLAVFAAGMAASAFAVRTAVRLPLLESLKNE